MRGGQGKNIRLRGGAIVCYRDYLPNPTSPPYPIKNERSLSQSEGLQRRSELQNAAELSSIEHEHTISDNAKLESLRTHFNKDLLIGHLNINSIQNKFEELTATSKTIGAHVMFISETKIDSSYPNAQFSIPGYSLYGFSIIFIGQEKTQAQ